MNCSPPGFSFHRILQARILEWVAIPFFRNIPDPGIEPRSPTLQADTLPSEPPGKSMDLCVHPVLFLFLMLRPYANILVSCFYDTDVKSACVWSLYEQCCVSIWSIGSTQCSALCILLTISVFIQVKRPFLKEKDSSGV